MRNGKSSKLIQLQNKQISSQTKKKNFYEKPIKYHTLNCQNPDTLIMLNIVQTNNIYKSKKTNKHLIARNLSCLR